MEAQQAADRLSAVSLNLSGKAGEEGKLFGSITSQDIADALARAGHTVDKRRIELEHPIKTVGEHAVDSPAAPRGSCPAARFRRRGVTRRP